MPREHADKYAGYAQIARDLAVVSEAPPEPAPVAEIAPPKASARRAHRSRIDHPTSVITGFYCYRPVLLTPEVSETLKHELIPSLQALLPDASIASCEPALTGIGLLPRLEVGAPSKSKRRYQDLVDRNRTKLRRNPDTWLPSTRDTAYPLRDFRLGIFDGLCMKLPCLPEEVSVEREQVFDYFEGLRMADYNGCSFADLRLKPARSRSILLAELRGVSLVALEEQESSIHRLLGCLTQSEVMLGPIETGPPWTRYIAGEEPVEMRRYLQDQTETTT
jgi:hypothetical protein